MKITPINLNFFLDYLKVRLIAEYLNLYKRQTAYRSLNFGGTEFCFDYLINYLKTQN